jgi:3-oxoacyl-[acyl-carrier-protein] synthase III
MQRRRRRDWHPLQENPLESGVQNCIRRIIGTGSHLPTQGADQRGTRGPDRDHRASGSSSARASANVISPAEGELTSDLALQAAEKAIEAAGIDVSAKSISSSSPRPPPDRESFPSTACVLQAKLGVTNGCPAFDVQAVCSGFVYAVTVADQFIRSGQVSATALVVGAETLSRITDWSDRGNCILWGDGAGAVVLQGHPMNPASSGDPSPCRRPLPGSAVCGWRRLAQEGRRLLHAHVRQRRVQDGGEYPGRHRR